MVADHQARAILLFEQLAGLRVGLLHLDQLIDHGFQQIDLHGLEIAADTGIFCIFFRQRRQQGLQRHGDGFFVQLAQLVARFAFPLRQAGQLLIEALFEHGDVGMEALALGLRQLGELRLVQGLAVEHRGEGDVAAVAVQRHVLFQRQALDDVQRLVVALIEGAVDGAFFLLIGRMLEHRGKGRQQVVDQAVDVGDKRPGGAGRQLQRTRLARLVEVVDVDLIGRGFQALGFRLQVAFDERETPGAGLAHDEDVITGARHGHAELQRLDRALLAEYAAERLQVIGTGEIELLGGKGTGQCIGRQPQAGCNGIGHRKSLTQAGEPRGFACILALACRPWQGVRCASGVQCGAGQAKLRGRQNRQSRRLDRLAAAQTIAIRALGQAQLGQADPAHAGLGLGLQGFQHLIVLPLLRLLGKIRRMATGQIPFNGIGAGAVLGKQRIERRMGVEGRHGHAP